MKTIIRLLILIAVLSFAGKCLADTSIEVVGPNALTYHVMMGDPAMALKFANKVSGDGRLIDNQEFGVSLVTSDADRFHSETIFAGQDSIGYAMYGAMFEYGVVAGNWQLGVAAGAYIQDENPWVRDGLISWKMTEIGTTDIVPVIGVVANYKIYLNDHVYININNIFSAIITNTTVSLGWQF